MGYSLERFAIEYCKDNNGKRAAERIGVAESNAASWASHKLTEPKVQQLIQNRHEELAAAAALTPEWVLRQWKMIAEADPNELIKSQRVNCRHCWGIGFQYQWTSAEYFREAARAQAAKKEPPDCMGGFGFRRLQRPNPECDECNGAGEEFISIADTDKLTGPARRLYAGVKQGKFGIEVIMRDQDGALANISKYLGMIIEKKELTGPNGGPMGITHLSPEDLTDEQLASVIGAKVEEATEDAK